MVWDSCHVVVMVHESASPLYNGEIQQAEEFVLVSPDYVATAASMSPDIIGANDTPGQYSIILKNEGLLDDAYNINCTLDGPAGWTGEFTTVNNTYPFGQIDSVQVSSGDSTEITLMINPNFFDGSGTATLEFESRNGPGIVGSVSVSYVTNTGVHLLVVDASEEGYASMITSPLDSFYVGRYGAVSRSALQVPGLDLSYFTMISWSAGDAGSSAPAFYPDEVNNLEAYLDQGGNLLLNGQNVGEDIFEPTGQSQFAQSFFNNYLHANYVADIGPSFFFRGIDSDPITDGVVFSLQSIYTMHPDEISPNGPNANTILTYGTGPSINSIKADDGNHKVVYFGIGFEQINDAGGIVDSLVARSVRWLTEGIVLNNRNENQVVSSYSLQQNYPNPFNPSTTIKYSLAEDVNVNLKIYDVMGREITELVNEKQNAGSHQYYFDASNLSSGIYFYKLTAGDFISVKKMTLLK
ncbi:MAG: T9SS type A sorting domain-containing protein [Ignavibacteriaceae bacterium]|nr:T9SS type A sorting domain-containing protein [Ignavibacteria bacterium]MBT8391625.1 T9SS type A sorting domain-containing protein [Ignavibacteria bacterium]NNJ53046.1 T9SS type A sorting domain-containing protein [Ignavibacteriaceae bacterium]